MVQRRGLDANRANCNANQREDAIRANLAKCFKNRYFSANRFARIDSRESAKRWCANRLPTAVRPRLEHYCPEPFQAALLPLLITALASEHVIREAAQFRNMPFYESILLLHGKYGLQDTRREHDSFFRYFREPLWGPPTHRVPKPPSNKKINSKNPENPDYPQT